MSPGAINHGGGVDSGGAEHTPGPWTASVERRPLPARGHWYVVMDAEENGLGEFYGDDHEANCANLRMAASAPDLHRLLTKSLCTLQALVSNMEESGWQPIETAPKDEDVFILAKRAGAQVPFAASYDADFDNWYTFNGALENCGVKFEPTHWMHLSEPGQSVLGTFDLEALKTLVGEIDDVLGGTE
jgi:hypothetical protein